MFADECPPVLLVVFNRPEVTAKALTALREVAPPVLFIAADGPRVGVSTDEANCAEVRQITREIDWPCEVVRLEHETNLGLHASMWAAIDWFFDSVDRGVILEDDCVCHPDFFRLARHVLDEYADDSSVAYLTAVNMAPKRTYGDGSYFFASGGHIWGWASWRRAWRGHRAVLEDWPLHRPRVVEIDNPLTRPLVIKGDDAYGGKKCTWARFWHLAVLASEASVIVPSENLVVNVGFGPDATHTVSSRHTLFGLQTTGLDAPFREPSVRTPSRAYDRRLLRYHSGPLKRRVRRRLQYIWRGHQSNS